MFATRRVASMSVVATFVLLVLVSLAAGTRATAARECGDCDTLGFTCLPPDANQADLCGRPLDIASCPVPSCQAFCDGTGELGRIGRCSPVSFSCLCETVDAPAVIAPLLPAECEPLACATVTSSLVCAPPAGLVDACTGLVFDVRACASSSLLSCNVQCDTPDAASVCAADGLACVCDARRPITAAAVSSVAAAATPTSPVPSSSVVLSSDITYFAVNNEIRLGTGAIIGMTLNTMMCLGLVLVVIWYYMMQMDQNKELIGTHEHEASVAMFYKSLAPTRI